MGVYEIKGEIAIYNETNEREINGIPGHRNLDRILFLGFKKIKIKKRYNKEKRKGDKQEESERKRKSNHHQNLQTDYNRYIYKFVPHFRVYAKIR